MTERSFGPGIRAALQFPCPHGAERWREGRVWFFRHRLPRRASDNSSSAARSRARDAGARHATYLAGILLGALVCTAPAHATVFEYGPNGEVKIDGQRRSERNEETEPKSAPTSQNVVDGTKSYSPYPDLARDIALRHAGSPGPQAAGLDVTAFIRLFTELVRAESAFDPRALSPKGAQGLGQLMPATARSLGVTDPWDPVQNLDGAARYLCAQLERFGDARLALAAYNAGPHRVSQYDGIPPYRETRAYVARISAAAGLAPTTERAPPATRASTGSPATQSTPDSSQGNTSVWTY